MPPQPSFTLGIEEEFQVVDPETRELQSHIAGDVRGRREAAQGRDQARDARGGHRGRHADLHRRRARAARGDAAARARSSTSAARADCASPPSGTHPISHWASVPITSNERYDQIVYDLQMVARANLIFGLHVHVAIEDLETRIQVMNAARYFLPHVFALSVNSPFWCGQNTGWKSYRAKVFERFPRTGIPDYFRSDSEYEEYVQLLIKTNCIDNAEEDLVGRAAASVLPDARVPHLRRADARRRDHLHRRALPGHHRTNSGRSTARTWAGASTAAAAQREQGARGAVRHRRKADRLRQARGSAVHRAARRAARVRR